METNFLHKYFLSNSQKRLHKWLHYFDVYDRHFARFRGKAPTVLEIGVMGGGSLQMWREYFGAGAKIVGLDIDPACKKHGGESIEVIIGSQSDEEVVKAIFKRYGEIDIIIDDGSHRSSDMIATMQIAYDNMSKYGVYLVEDTHTNYWSPDRSKSFMEYSKTLIDQLNSTHSKGTVPTTNFTQSTDSVSYYDSMVVFEKRPQGVRKHVVTIGMSESAQKLESSGD